MQFQNPIHNAQKEVIQKSDDVIGKIALEATDIGWSLNEGYRFVKVEDEMELALWREYILCVMHSRSMDTIADVAAFCGKEIIADERLRELMVLLLVQYWIIMITVLAVMIFWEL